MAGTGDKLLTKWLWSQSKRSTEPALFCFEVEGLSSRSKYGTQTQYPRCFEGKGLLFSVVAVWSLSPAQGCSEYAPRGGGAPALWCWSSHLSYTPVLPSPAVRMLMFPGKCFMFTPLWIVIAFLLHQLCFLVINSDAWLGFENVGSGQSSHPENCVLNTHAQTLNRLIMTLCMIY